MHLVRAATLNGLEELITRLGLNASALLRESGLPANAFNREAGDDYLPVAGMEKIYTLAEAKSQQSNLAARAGSQQDVATLLGVIGFVMQQCKTVGEALKELKHYFSYQIRGAYLQIDVIDAEVVFEFFVQDSYQLPSTRHSTEFALAASISIMRSFCGEQWKPRFTLFTHSESSGSSDLEQYFYSPVYFNQEKSAIIFSAQDLYRPITSANPGLNRILHGYLGMLAEEYSDDQSLQVEKLIRQALSSGGCDADKVAAFMGVSRRTLHRILKQEGTTFTQLLDEVRQDMATKLLKQNQVSVAIIADILCYSDASAFSRAFKRWFDVTPQQFRNSL